MTRLGALSLFAVLLTGETAIAAEGNCGDAKAVLNGLKAQYGEDPAYTSTTKFNGKDIPFMITLNTKTGTWTALYGIDDGTLCMGGGGDHWAAVPPSAETPKPAPGSLPAPMLLPNGLIRIHG